jgi:hypothetical protein
VDVTTEYPAGGEAAINMRVAIGGSGTDWYGSSVGGVAYRGSFGDAFYSPCFVFPAELDNGLPKFVSECISHEGESEGWVSW